MIFIEFFVILSNLIGDFYLLLFWERSLFCLTWSRGWNHLTGDSRGIQTFPHWLIKGLLIRLLTHVKYWVNTILNSSMRSKGTSNAWFQVSHLPNVNWLIQILWRDLKWALSFRSMLTTNTCSWRNTIIEIIWTERHKYCFLWGEINFFFGKWLIYFGYFSLFSSWHTLHLRWIKWESSCP